MSKSGGRPSLGGPPGPSHQVIVRLPARLLGRARELQQRLGARSLSEAVRYALERVRLPRRGEGP